MSRRFGTVAVVGAPNAGKSTLVNALVGQKVAIVTAKAQTTRTRLMGIAIAGETQILLTDTPGIFEPRRRLDRAMVAAAWDSAQDADLIALVVDAATGISRGVAALTDKLKDRAEARILILNKVDLVRKEELLTLVTQFEGRAEFEAIYMISAASGDGVADLKAALAERMPEGPWHFPEDQVSDATDRMMAAEVTREQLYRQLHAELPMRVRSRREIEERKDGSIVIHQQILVAATPKGDRPRQRRQPDQADRRGREAGAHRSVRPQGAPLPPRQGEPEMGGRSGALSGNRVGMGGVSDRPVYVRVSEGAALPPIDEYRPFRAVVVLDSDYSGKWQDEVSRWLVDAGCLYMMAWGPNCTRWDDSVDYAQIAKYPDGAPDPDFVMTTWHEDETLEEVFWFAGFCASDQYGLIKHSLIVHVGTVDRGAELVALYAQAETLVEREDDQT